ncbi:C Jun amino terminal kinase interacting protein [Pelomyxa schiedti]|nr:C Jun amino terminal kinase interacting protein [Pelomyxa schiedti]
MGNFIVTILMESPYLWACTGLALCIGLSVVGSSWGIWTIGTATLGVSIHKGRLETRNLVSILFCEALSIYGIIVSIIMTTKAQTQACWPIAANDYMAGYQMFSAGLITGFCNMLAGFTLGIVGKGIAVSTAAVATLFVKLLIVLIFGEVLGLYGMIVSLIETGNASFTSCA